MDYTHVSLKTIGVMSLLGGLAALDAAPIATIILTILVSIVSGFLAARYAVREAKKEIDLAFVNHVNKLHSDHTEFIETVTDDRIKSGG